MKNIKKLFSAVLAFSMLLSMGMLQAQAGNTYTPVNGGETTFKKFLIMDAGDSVPNATFAFTIAPGTARSANTSDNSVMQVLPGVGTPTIGTATFAPGNSTETTAGSNIDVARAASDRASGLTAATGVELESGEKYATQTVTVDFSGISFDEPGIYRYIITETANAAHAAAGIMHDNDVDRVLDVYVVHKEASAAVTEAWIYGGTEYTTEADAKAAADVDQSAASGEGDYSGITHREAQAAVAEGLEVAGYVLHKNDDDVVIGTDMGSNDVAAAGDALDDKTDGFTNEYNSKDLVFKKEVSGNQASRDKYFAFTVTLTDVNDADVYVVSLADDSNAYTTDGNADGTSGSNNATISENQNKSNPTSVTGAQLKAGVKFYLQHGQSIAIRGIAPNASYTVTENAEDYKSTASAVSGYEDATTGVIGTVAGNHKAVQTSYLNTRDGLIPTGVLTLVGPAVAFILLGVLGISVVLIGKRRKEETAE